MACSSNFGKQIYRMSENFDINYVDSTKVCQESLEAPPKNLFFENIFTTQQDQLK